MKATCSVAELNQCLTNVLLSVPSRSSLTVLEGVLVEAGGNGLTLVGYNTEMGITSSLAARVESEGRIVIPARVFSDITRKMESDRITIEVLERFSVRITGGMSEFVILGIDPADYPELPVLGSATTVRLAAGTLASMLSMTSFAISTSESRPIQNGCLFELENRELSVVAVDGYRLAVRREPVAEDLSLRFVVPGRTVAELLKLLSDSKNVVIEVSRNHILFTMDRSTLISRLLIGDFLSYRNSIPLEAETTVLISPRSLISAVERVSLIISDRINSPLRLTVAENVIRMNSRTDVGTAYDECACSTSGDFLEIGFNNQFLLEALREADCDMIRLEMNGPVKPLKITPRDGDGFTFLVLPMRLR